MKTTMKLITLALLFALIAPSAMAQKEVTVEGRYRYVMEDDETQAQARAKAIDQARIEGLREKFGTYITGTGLSQVVDGTTKYVHLGMNEVKGEWVCDLEEPKVTRELDPSGHLIFTAIVRFKARERINEAVEVQAKLLRNGTTLRHEGSEFNSGDQMYMWFKSPCDGFVSVYIEGEDDTVFRLLPYSRSKEHSYKVRANTEYTFFSRQLRKKSENGEEEESDLLIDEQLMTASTPTEWNRICVIFSPNEFHIAADKKGQMVSGKKEGLSLWQAQRTRELPKKEFQDWLAKQRTRDPKMSYIPIDIVIHRKQE